MSIELLNEDCVQGMKKYPDKYFDLAIVDPPYGIRECSGKDKSRNRNRIDQRTGRKIIVKKEPYKIKRWDFKKPGIEFFHELFRVSINQIIWGANHLGYLPPSPCWIVWDKDNGNCSFADCELAWTSFRTAVRKFKYRWSGFRQEDMTNREIRIHPTQKPIALYRWLLKKYGRKEGPVLDTHLGSGSIAIACYDMGFNLVGFEIEKDYFRAALKRLHEHQEEAYACTEIIS